MLDLVNNLQETFSERIKRLDWMTEETKQRGLEKLKAFTKKIAYPDKWKDYSTITIKKNDLLGNIQQPDPSESSIDSMHDRLGALLQHARNGCLAGEGQTHIGRQSRKPRPLRQGFFVSLALTDILRGCVDYLPICKRRGAPRKPFVIIDLETAPRFKCQSRVCRQEQLKP